MSGGGCLICWVINNRLAVIQTDLWFLIDAWGKIWAVSNATWPHLRTWGTSWETKLGFIKMWEGTIASVAAAVVRDYSTEGLVLLTGVERTVDILEKMTPHFTVYSALHWQTDRQVLLTWHKDQLWRLVFRWLISQCEGHCTKWTCVAVCPEEKPC